MRAVHAAEMLDDATVVTAGADRCGARAHGDTHSRMRAYACPKLRTVRYAFSYARPVRLMHIRMGSVVAVYDTMSVERRSWFDVGASALCLAVRAAARARSVMSCDVVWCGVMLCGVMLCDVMLCDVMWCGMLWCGVV